MLGDGKMEESRLFGNLYILGEWLYKLLFANLIWFVFNLPIIFLLINLLLAEEMAIIFTLLFFSMILLPFVFFPATYSLFSLIFHFINKEDVNILGGFWSYYQKNYKKSMKIGLLSSLFWTVLLIDFMYALQFSNDYLFYLFVLLGFFGIVYHLILFCTGVQMKGKALTLIKNAAIIMLQQPILSISLGIISAVIVVIASQWLTFLFPLFLGSMIAFLSILVFLKIYTSIAK